MDSEDRELRCPKCTGASLEWRADKGLWRCRGCEIYFEGQPPTAETDPRDERILEGFPLPIALAWSWTLDPSRSPTTRLGNLLASFQQAIRLPTLLLLSDYLRGSVVEPRLSSRIRRMRTPYLNDWQGLLAGLHKYRASVFPEGGFVPGLLEAVQRLRKMQDPSGGNLIQRLIGVRNDRAHGNLSADRLAAPILERELEHVRTLLSTLDPLWALDLLIPFGPQGHHVVLRGASPPLTPHANEDLALDHLLQDFGVVARRPDGACLGLFPLGIGEASQRQASELLLFDGFTKEHVVYIGDAARTRRRGPYAALQQRFDEKAIDPSVPVDQAQPRTLADWAAESSERRLDTRQARFEPAAYVERPGLEAAIRSWLENSSAPAALVLSEAGMGKSSLLSLIASECLQRRQEHGEVVLLVFGEDLRGVGSLWERVRVDLGLSAEVASLDRLLRAWRGMLTDGTCHEPPRLTLIVDALNEGRDLQSLLAQAAELAEAASRSAGDARVKLLFSVRSGPYRALERRWQEKALSPLLQRAGNFHTFRDPQDDQLQHFLAIKSFSDDLACSAWEALARSRSERGEPYCPVPWPELPQEVRGLLGQPLLVRLTHTAFAGQSQVPPGLSEDALWEAWLKELLTRHPGLSAHLGLVLDRCVQIRSAVLDPDTCHEIREEWGRGRRVALLLATLDPLEALQSVGVLRFEAGGHVFNHQRMLETLLVRHVAQRHPEPDAAVLRDLAARAATLPELTQAVADRLAAVPEHKRREVYAELDWTANEDAWRPILAAAWSRGPGQEGYAAWLEGISALAADFSPQALHVAAGVLYRDVARALAGLVPTVGMLDLARCAQRLQAQALAGGVRDLSARHRHAGLERSIADKLRSLGQTEQAAMAFREAHRLLEALLKEDSENRDLRNELAIAQERLGDAARNEGDLEEALAWWERSRAGSAALVAEFPDIPLYRSNLSIAHGKVGDVLISIEGWAAARPHFDKRLQLRAELVAESPRNHSYRSRYAYAVLRVGDVLRKQDQLEAALDRYRHAFAEQETLIEEAPLDIRFRSVLGTVCERIGLTHRGLGNVREARAAFQECAQARERAHLGDPGQTLKLSSLTLAWTNLARCERDMGWPERALILYRRAVDARAELHRRDPSQRLFVRQGAEARSYLARTLRELDRLEEALSEYETSARATRELLVDSRGNRRLLKLLAERLVGVAETKRRLGRVPEAAEHVEEALELLVRRHPDDPGLDSVASLSVSVCLGCQGRVQRDLGELGFARNSLLRALAVIKRKLRSRPAYEIHSAFLLLELADVEAGLGKEAECRSHADAAVVALGAVAVADRHNVRSRQKLIEGLLRHSDLFEGLGWEEASESRQSALEAIEVLRQNEPSNLGLHARLDALLSG